MNKIFNNDARQIDKHVSNNSVDLVITSPPYDDMRDYTNDIEWNFEVFKEVAKQIYDSLKDGGTLVWIVNDKYINSSRSLTTWKQLIYFVEEIGFKAHDIMVWQKPGFAFPHKNRYHQVWEPMLVLTKGKPKTFNPIMDRENKYVGRFGKHTKRQKDGSMKLSSKEYVGNKMGRRFNVWLNNHAGQENVCKTNKHPAMFPRNLVRDLITSFSNDGEIVMDPFMGSGTTALAAIETNRQYIGFEISKEYIEIIENNIQNN